MLIFSNNIYFIIDFAVRKGKLNAKIKYTCCNFVIHCYK